MTDYAYNDTELNQQESVALQNYMNKVQLRSDIQQSAGDLSSLLGSTADTAQILLCEVAELAAALNKANSLAEVRAASQPLHDLLAPMRQRIADGQTQMPYQVKGVEASLQDIEQRATTVAAALQQAQEPTG